MRSTLVKLCVVSALVTPGCGKDAPSDTKADSMTPSTSGDAATVASASETGGATVVVTGETTPMMTEGQPTTSGAETSASTSAESGSLPDTGGATFLIMPDGGTMGTKECSVWDQECPAGQKCMPWADNGSTAWNATKCVPVDDAMDMPGDACTVDGSAVSGLDSCALGVLCWDVKPDTMSGTCVAMCKGPESSPTCDLDSSCFISNDGVLTLCLPKCDPLTQDCASENLCIPNPQMQAEFTCVLDASGDKGTTFDPCEYVNACDKGFYCATPAAGMECNADATGCCLPFCDVTDPPMCPGTGQSCVPWYEMGSAPPGGENIGLCTLPL